MSKIIRTFEDRMACNVVQTSDDKYYYVDSTDTFDVGYKTMVFACNKNGSHIDFCDLYVDRYATEKEMLDKHKKICENLEKYLSGKEK